MKNEKIAVGGSIIISTHPSGQRNPGEERGRLVHERMEEREQIENIRAASGSSKASGMRSRRA